MLDRTTQADSQDEHVTDRKAHEVAMAMHSLASAVDCVSEMSMSPEYRDLLVKDLGQISGAALAIGLAWSRLKAREKA